MKLTIPRHQPAVKKFEYYLPGDDNQVMIDAIAMGSLICTRDYATQPTLAREAITEIARVGCEQLKVHTTAQELTNKFEYFLGLWTRHFTEAYLNQQDRYKLDRGLYARDKAAVEQVGWVRAYVLKKENIALIALKLQAMSKDSGFTL